MSNNMRLCRRSMVEVLIKKKDLLGAWHYAEIVEDDGDGYIVRYFHSPGVFKKSTDKVPTNVVRPRAPPVTSGSTNWSVGDVVEVLDDCVWRVSMIEEVLEDGFYYIQVMGSVDEFKVKTSCIRPRQEWIKNQWLLMGKNSGIDENLLSRTRKRIDMLRQSDLINKKEVKKSAKPSKKLKRSSKDNLSVDKVSLKCVKKQRVVDKKVDRVAVPDMYSCTGQVDTPVDLRVTTRTNNADDDCVSLKSSVASSSCQDNNNLRSDAKSLDHKGGMEGMRVSHEDNLRTRELELYNYRCILEALYAFGPLSWEDEMLLTDVRQKYCVTNDEHLKEIRRLKSRGGSIMSTGGPGVRYTSSIAHLVL